MDKEIYTEQIEAYLLNKLDAEDKIAFRQLIEKDPILKNELQFQEEIIEAIRLNRKLELKARLNAIQVNQSPLSQLSRITWIGTATLAMGLLLGVVILRADLFEISSSDIQNPPKAKINLKQKQAPSVSELSQKDNTTASTSPELSSDHPTNTATNSLDQALDQENLDTSISSVPVAKQELISQDTYTYDLKINKPRRFMSKVDNILGAQKEIYAIDPEDEEGVKGIFDGTNEANLEEIAHRNQLSYQYYNEELFLYNYQGSYKIIRIYIKEEERHFLYYQNQYYELNTNQVEKKELRAISNSDLIELLNLARAKFYDK
ncbi:MAG: hypothetical protein NW226_06775 [Microscillaceae bacterium]|nr:hypothetical protein [Microscillaceae bacterium]